MSPCALIDVDPLDEERTTIKTTMTTTAAATAAPMIHPHSSNSSGARRRRVGHRGEADTTGRRSPSTILDLAVRLNHRGLESAGSLRRQRPGRPGQERLEVQRLRRMWAGSEVAELGVTERPLAYRA